MLFVVNCSLYLSMNRFWFVFCCFFGRYHFDGSTRQFFEGWYFKVSIPEKRQTFCFIYTIENPAFPNKLTPAEEEKYGRRSTGAGVQILGAYDKYISQYSEESHNFWGSKFLWWCFCISSFLISVDSEKNICPIWWVVLNGGNENDL